MPHTRQYDKEIIAIVKKNLNTICSRRGVKREIAKICNCSEALVTKWCSYASSTIPTATDLYAISKYVDVPMEWFFRQAETGDNADNMTYSQLFERLKKLIDLHIIKPDDVKDYILKYLLLRNKELENSGINSEKIAEWRYTISQKFNVPFSNFSLAPEICKKAVAKYPEIKEINEDDTYCNLAKVINDQDIINQIIFKKY